MDTTAWVSDAAAPCLLGEPCLSLSSSLQKAYPPLVSCITLLGPPEQNGTQTDWLKQQEFIFLQFWRLEGLGQDVGRLVFLRPLSLTHR